MTDDWEAKVRGGIKAELKRRNMTYQDLADKLCLLGVKDMPENIANKISRGKFSAVFLVQCLSAIGCTVFRIEE